MDAEWPFSANPISFRVGTTFFSQFSGIEIPLGSQRDEHLPGALTVDGDSECGSRRAAPRNGVGALSGQGLSADHHIDTQG
ncbi:hypothetical protein ABZ341_02370 [Streptomyces sp. NPDC006173]|uniref:hypothetical protein n=1 Tax=Streptomyces sp. NPDC006173 TaxID=3155349 RepID=UPI0033D31B21